MTETTWGSHYLSDLEVFSIKRVLSLQLLKITTLLYIRVFLIVLELNILVKIKKVMGNISNFKKYAVVKKLTKKYEVGSCEENGELTHREIEHSVICVFHKHHGV